MTKSVILAVGLTTYALESVAFHNALETFTLGSSGDVHPLDTFGKVCEGDHLAELQLHGEIILEFHELALRRGFCLFEMALKGLAGVFFLDIVIGKLYSGITIFLDCTDLRNNTRTSLNNGARHIFAGGIENGSHSDFFSN